LAEKDYAPKRLGELEKHSKLKSLTFAQLLQAMLVLVGAGRRIRSNRRPGTGAQALPCAQRHLCEQGGEISVLASPVTGGGVPCRAFTSCCCLPCRMASKRGRPGGVCMERALAPRPAPSARRQAARIGEGNIAELTTMANEFARKRIPILKALEVL